MKQYKRSCPECQNELQYKSRSAFYKAKTKESLCRSCSISLAHSQGRLVSCLNKVPKTQVQIDQAKELLSRVSNRKPIYDCWLNKYGKEIADQKLESFKAKLSIRNSGEGNPMYGKPCPCGGGNGWSGWYKGWFFRSLGELSFMVNTIELQNLSWLSAETKECAINYIDDKGNKRTYFPDFLVDGTRLIEIKPKKLWNLDTNLQKKKYAEAYCKEKGWIYEMIEPISLSFNELQVLYNSGLIKFTKKYEYIFNKRTEYNS